MKLHEQFRALWIFWNLSDSEARGGKHTDDPSRKQQLFIHLNMHVSAFKGRFGSESDVGELRRLGVFFLLGSSGLYFALHVGSDANNVVG